MDWNWKRIPAEYLITSVKLCRGGKLSKRNGFLHVMKGRIEGLGVGTPARALQVGRIARGSVELEQKQDYAGAVRVECAPNGAGIQWIGGPGNTIRRFDAGRFDPAGYVGCGFQVRPLSLITARMGAVFFVSHGHPQHCGGRPS